MLRTPAPFPQVGSFALYVDTNLPVAQQRPELVRVLRLAGTIVFIAFPLRAGASGNTTAKLADLIDATPLTIEEARELTDLERALHGRARPNPTKAIRRHALRDRLLWSAILGQRLQQLDALQLRAAA